MLARKSDSFIVAVKHAESVWSQGMNNCKTSLRNTKNT
jgi:hypothetical protein